MTKQPSSREQIQNELVEFLESKPKFDAPYGIISGLEKIGHGKVRTIAFGVCRVLDATIVIWSSNKIVIRGQGALAYLYEGTYSNIEEVKEALSK